MLRCWLVTTILPITSKKRIGCICVKNNWQRPLPQDRTRKNPAPPPWISGQMEWHFTKIYHKNHPNVRQIFPTWILWARLNISLIEQGKSPATPHHGFSVPPRLVLALKSKAAPMYSPELRWCSYDNKGFQGVGCTLPSGGIVGCTVPPIPVRGPPMVKSLYKP